MSVVSAAFDPFPAPKGAATHIAHFASGLAEAFGEVELVTVEPGQAAQEAGRDLLHSLHPGVRHVPLPAPGKTLIDRVLAFRQHLTEWWGGRQVEVAHVRSIYEGYPLLRAPRPVAERLVYEVNGLPSIELKYHYRDVADDHELLAKLSAQEAALLEAADLVVTPSQVTGELLLDQGLDPDRLRVIPNGVALERFPHRLPRELARTPERGPLRLLYAGTMTAWQGVYLLLEALALYLRDAEAQLVLVGPVRKRQRLRLEERAHELGLGERVELLPPCGQAALARLHHEADVVFAPLMPNDRNLIQGCCPLKVLEAMASGTPLIAADLPVVRELTGEDGERALLVRPGSAKAFKDGLLRLEQEAGLAQRLSLAARERVEQAFSWERSRAGLVDAYAAVLGLSPARS